MTLHYHVTGTERKALAYAIGELIETKPEYLKMPTKAYAVGDYRVEVNGDVSFDGFHVDSDEVEMLLEELSKRGFDCDPIDYGEDAEQPATEPTQAPPEAPTDADAAEDADAPDGADNAQDGDERISDLVVSLPIDGFDAFSLNRLHALIASKQTLLKKALGIESLPVQVTENRVYFPWFHGEIDADHAQAYMNLIIKMCAMAINSKRVTAKDKATDNDKYAFRCFLLRLGFIGDGYKVYRKILLEKLEGSSAFRTIPQKDGEEA